MNLGGSSQLESANVGDTWYYCLGMFTSVEPDMEHLTVVKVTPKGVWLSPHRLFTTGYSPEKKLNKQELDDLDAFFVLFNATRRKAFPTEVKALLNFNARKRRQLLLLSLQYERAKEHQLCAVRVLNETHGITAVATQECVSSQAYSKLRPLLRYLNSFFKDDHAPLMPSNPEEHESIQNAYAELKRMMPRVSF